MKEKRFWWVNHKQTQKQEVEEGFLWSPFAKTNGQKNYFYDTMALAQPGDYVLSYAVKVRYVGIVERCASRSGKPISFGKKGDAWSDIGWRLPVSWSTLSNPVSTIEHKDLLRSMWPEKYSPIQAATGHGNQTCYLAEVSEQLFDKVCELGKTRKEKIHNAIEYGAVSDEDIEELILASAQASGDLSDTEFQQFSKARKGQGRFRDAVFKRLKCCPITGVSNKDFLIASHIKPWKDCDTLHERLDGYNGLPLSPHVDRLFDRGFISFLDDGRMILSSQLGHSIASAWGLIDKLNRALIPVDDRQSIYLAYHREYVFKP